MMEVVGVLASLFSMLAFIPQAVHTWKTKRTKDISLSSYIILFSSAVLWITYGLLKEDLPIIVTNGTICIVVIPILILKLRNHK